MNKLSTRDAHGYLRSCYWTDGLRLLDEWNWEVVGKLLQVVRKVVSFPALLFFWYSRD